MGVLFIAVLGYGCDQSIMVGDTPDGAVGDASVDSLLTYGDFYDRLGATYCSGIEACCGGLPSEFAGRELCTGASILPEEARATPLDDGLRAGAGACLEALIATRCDTPSGARSLSGILLTSSAEAACASLLPRASEVCAGAACDGACVEDTCYPRVPSGSSCCVDPGSGSICSESLCGELDYCDAEGDRLCHGRLRDGEPCAGDSQCLSLFCDPGLARCASASIDNAACR